VLALLPAVVPDSHGAALLQAAADACGLAGSCGMQLQAAAASRCEHDVDPCNLDSQHLQATTESAHMHSSSHSPPVQRGE
jgi:hypothetical protein